MRIVVDLNRCESSVQCVFAAPTVFRLIGEESLEFDYAPVKSCAYRSNGRPRPA